MLSRESPNEQVRKARVERLISLVHCTVKLTSQVDCSLAVLFANFRDGDSWRPRGDVRQRLDGDPSQLRKVAAVSGFHLQLPGEED